MGEVMNFPDTVEEFMEQYKITDTEKIYTNGVELIPIFRMKQWFEHISDNCTSYHKPYTPLCPLGNKDCIYDPAYIYFYYPIWYKSLYGNLTPEEAVKRDNCATCNGDGYDDEDK